jgi:undecaprenyl-diphosphatase
MKATTLNALIARIEAAEYDVCRHLNRGTRLRPVCTTFRWASRLGDGALWYVLMLALPLLYGSEAIRPALVMAMTGLAGVLFYRILKRTFVRERPFIAHTTIARGIAPLDRYSFPSGHTLHAVAFTWQGVSHATELAWVLVPLALLIAGSRIVLGLHYPSDVLAGAAIGASLGAIGANLA